MADVGLPGHHGQDGLADEVPEQQGGERERGAAGEHAEGAGEHPEEGACQGRPARPNQAAGIPASRGIPSICAVTSTAAIEAAIPSPVIAAP